MAQYQCTLHFPLVFMGYECSLQVPAPSLFHCLLFSIANFFTFPSSFCYCFLVAFFFFKLLFYFYPPSLKSY